MQAFEREFALLGEGQKFIFPGSEKVWMKMADSENVNGEFNAVVIFPETYDSHVAMFASDHIVYVVANYRVFSPEVKAL